jgi:hypothetical protein
MSEQTRSTDTGFRRGRWLAIMAIAALSTACGREDPLTFSLTPFDGVRTFTLKSQGSKTPPAVTFDPPLNWAAVIVPQTSSLDAYLVVNLKQGDTTCFVSVITIGPVEKDATYSFANLGFGKPYCPDSEEFQTSSVEVVLFDDGLYPAHTMASITLPTALTFRGAVPLYLE